MIEHEFVVRFAGALWLGYQRLEPKVEAHAARRGSGPLRQRDRATGRRYLRRARRRMQAALARVDRELQHALRGESPPEQIALAVTRCIEQLLDISAALRRQDVPVELRRARELTAELADRPLRELGAFIELAVAVHERDLPPLGRLSERLGFDPGVEKRLRSALSPDA